MGENSTSIKVDNVSKIYRMYNKQIDRLKESLNPFSNTKYYKEHYALDNVSFTIEKGEIVGIIGKNGSGKSTLLKIITGVLTPSTGSITVNGKISALLELGAGFNLEYTGLENIYFNGLVMGFKREEMDKKLKSIIDFADIGDFINQPVKTYSSGMFARLAFAVAINVEPEILIIDETLSVGDMYFQAKCMTKMKEMFKGGCTVIFVTHDTNAVKNLCKRTLYLEKGNLLCIGPSEEVVDYYAKKTRDEMIADNATKSSNEYLHNKLITTDGFEKSKINFIESSEFSDRVSFYRQGTMDVQLTHLQVLNSKNEDLETAQFNEKITIRMHVKFIKETRVSIGYHIRDSKNIEILGSNTVFEKIGEVFGKEGEKLIVDFTTKVPLVEGIYNLSTVISTPTIHNRSALFVDYTENSYIFQVAENFESKVWNKVYVNNEVKIYRI